jgi:MFS family permease
MNTYQWIVVIGVVPAVFAVLVLIALVHDVEKTRVPGDSKYRLPLSGSMAGVDTRFKVFLGIMALFTLGNSSDFFVILKAQYEGSSVLQALMMLVVLNIAYSVTSLPVGILSDRLGRKRLIGLGWFIYALVYLGFAVSSERWQVWLLFAGYGVYYGVVEGVARAFVADLVAAERRGIAYGMYHGVVGLTLLPASLIAGWLWDSVSPASPFYLGAALAFLAMLTLLLLIKE